jgi:hypothetical protein
MGISFCFDYGKSSAVFWKSGRLQWGNLLQYRERPAFLSAGTAGMPNLPAGMPTLPVFSKTY